MKSILKKSTGGEAYWGGIGLAAGWHGSRVVLGSSQTELFTESIYALCLKSEGRGLKKNKKIVLMLLICIIPVVNIVPINNVEGEKKCIGESFVNMKCRFFAVRLQLV